MGAVHIQRKSKVLNPLMINLDSSKRKIDSQSTTIVVVVDVDDVDVAVDVAAVGVGTSEPALTDLQQMRLVEMGPYAEMKESIVPWPAIAAPLRGLAVPCQAL